MASNELPIRAEHSEDTDDRDLDSNATAEAPLTPPPLLRNRSSLRLITELTRERISLRYLHAWKQLHQPPFIGRNAFPVHDRSMPAPSACHDTGLTALAQLAALRICVRRAFVTIISRDTEYVLVEATRTMSLQSDFTSDERDKSWLGTSCFARADGINDSAVDAWRRARRYRDIPEEGEHQYTEGISPHWCIISDLGSNPQYSHRPFATHCDLPRFFFSVPLRDADGTVIGSLSLLDDKPRSRVSAHDMLFCEDLSDTITQHVLGSVIAVQRQRSEQLIQALGAFINGEKSLKDWWLDQDRASMQHGGRRGDAVRSNRQSSARFYQEFGAAEGHSSSLREKSPPRTEKPTLLDSQVQSRPPRSASDGNAQASKKRTNNAVSGIDFVSDPAQAPTNDNGRAVQVPLAPPDEASSQPKKEKGSRAFTKDYDMTAQRKDAYCRASNLLREATGAFGVVFLDASAASGVCSLDSSHLPSTTTTPTDESTSTSGNATGTVSSSDDTKLPTNSDTDTSDNLGRRSKICKISGRSIQIGGTEDSPPLRLNERDMAKLIKAYPFGKVFNYAVSGTPYSGSEESTASGAGSSESAADVTSQHPRTNIRYNRHARLLRKVIGDARSIAFYPIRDSTNTRYRSCLFAWTLHANRFFDEKEDMTYISAFSHSLRAEISRIEAIASDVAKGKFISSVSHELRSPLHGILAGVELLQDTQLTAFQREMSVSVSLAGRTLLDTVNHILDYSKISNLSLGQRRDRARVDASRHKLAEVKESEATKGHTNPLTVVDLAHLTEEVVESVTSAYRFSRPIESLESNSGNKRQESVSVILNIDKRASWATAMTPGSWTRVITNLVGNALKYTVSGTVTISLFATTGYEDGDISQVTLQVEDTGIGMSKEFISNDLFVPFRQADSHSTGTGLGLSIVKEVAKEFNGLLDVQSELGKGSLVSVKFVAKFTEPSDATNRTWGGLSSSKGRHLRILDISNYLDYPRPPSTKGLAESLQQTASQWLGYEVSSSREMASIPRGSICAISENEISHLNTTRADGVETLIDTLAESDSRLLIYGRSIASCQPEFEFESFTHKPLYIHQPIGPWKLRRVIRYAKDSTTTRQPSDFGWHSDRARNTSPQLIRGDTFRRTSIDQTQKSYFDIPRSAESNVATPLITPFSFIQASSAASPEKPEAVDRQIDAMLDQPVSNLERRHGDTILLVEDNVINMRLLVALMKKQHLSHDCAKDGLEALDMFKEDPNKYSLILMDMNMPVMDGFESTAKIREYERKNHLRAVSICALTGVTNEEARSSAFYAGVNRYLTKPIQMKDLTKIVTEAHESQ